MSYYSHWCRKSWRKGTRTVCNTVCLILSPEAAGFGEHLQCLRQSKLCSGPGSELGAAGGDWEPQPSKPASHQHRQKAITGGTALPGPVWYQQASPLLSSQEPKVLAFLTSTGKSLYDITILTPNDNVLWLSMTLHNHFVSLEPLQSSAVASVSCKGIWENTNTPSSS